jgi:hydroxyacylglutathione hydrolase
MVVVHEFVDEGLGHSSYVIDLDDGTAAFIDPPRFPIAHETLADREQLRVAWTIDTHSHADYVTGSPGVAARHGAVFVAPAASRLEHPHRPIADGDRIVLSEAMSILAVATPGHTLDHHAYLLEERGRPVGLFTGGSLMVGTVGRTDLCGPALAVPLAYEMHRSLRRFEALTDDVAVYPTHGPGSFCSAPGATDRVSTLGRERATNPLLRTSDEDQFVEDLTAGVGTFPSYFAQLPELNRRGPSHFDALPALALLTAAQIEQRTAAGAVIVDARPFAKFGAGHIPGSLSNTLRPVFASWLGWLVDLGRPLVFIFDADQDRLELVRQCLDVGHENLIGELAGGLDAWAADGRPLATVSLVGVDRLDGRTIDVRQNVEYAAGHIPSARNVELASIATAALPDGEMTVMCGHGERAMTAAGILLARGRHDIAVFDGGPDTWAAGTGQPLQRER